MSKVILFVEEGKVTRVDPTFTDINEAIAAAEEILSLSPVSETSFSYAMIVDAHIVWAPVVEDVEPALEKAPVTEKITPIDDDEEDSE